MLDLSRQVIDRDVEIEQLKRRLEIAPPPLPVLENRESEGN
jgi:hypothetical protein